MVELINEQTMEASDKETSQQTISMPIPTPPAPIASPTPTQQQTTPDISTYMNIFNHAVRCTQLPACSIYSSRCIQMRRIIQHARNCGKNKVNECNVCRQLIALTIMHAKTCRDEACPAPYCASIKTRLDELNEMRARVESAYEYVRASFVLLDYKPKRTLALQTIHEHDHDDENHMNCEPECSDQVVNQENTDESMEREQCKLLTDIERVKSLETSNRTTLRSKTDVKFSKELAKFVFKKLINTHQLTDRCYTNLQYARLARLFMLENLSLLRRVSLTTTQTNNSSTNMITPIDLDDYLVLVIDLAHRFDRMLGKHTRIVHSQTVQTSCCNLLNNDDRGSAEKRIRDHELTQTDEATQIDDSQPPDAKKIRSV